MAIVLMASVVIGTGACGGSSVAPGGSIGSPVAPGGGVATKPAPASQAPTTTPALSTVTGGVATPAADDATAQAQTIAQLRDVSSLVLASADVPAGYTVRQAVPVTRTQVIAAQIGIRKLASYMIASDLEGAWAALYLKGDQASGLSSVVTRYGSASDALGYVDVAAALTVADYPTATSIELVQADSIGDKAVFLRTRLAGARILEYTWSQGRLTGQVILRYAGDTEAPDDVGLVVSLARKQLVKMQTFAQ